MARMLNGSVSPYLLLITAVLVLNIVSLSAADAIVLGKGNARILVSDKDSNRFDFNNDGLTDYFVRAHYTGNEKQLYKVDYTIQDECVDGDTYDEATMKLGFTNKEIDYTKRKWLTEGIEAWASWFKSPTSTDQNNRIDLVYLPEGTLPIPYPSSGDDVIQTNASDKHGSFTYEQRIVELDGQSGWKGSIFFKASEGSYYMWTIHPATGTEGCDTLAALGIPIIIK